MSLSRTVFEATAQFTRPADVIAYAAGDQVANNVAPGSVTPLNFSIPYMKGKGGMIRAASLVKSNSNITLADFRLYLFTSPISQAGDNLALNPTTAEARTFVGWYGFANSLNLLQFANGVYYYGYQLNAVQQMFLPIPEGCDGTLYGALIASAAYVPTASEVFSLRLVFDVE